MGAKVASVRLRDQSKLVYSPHVYGPSVYMQHYFNAEGFPSNMPQLWEGLPSPTNPKAFAACLAL